MQVERNDVAVEVPGEFTGVVAAISIVVVPSEEVVKITEARNGHAVGWSWTNLLVAGRFFFFITAAALVVARGAGIVAMGGTVI